MSDRMEEPSLLDFIKARLFPRKYPWEPEWDLFWKGEPGEPALSATPQEGEGPRSQSLEAGVTSPDQPSPIPMSDQAVVKSLEVKTLAEPEATAPATAPEPSPVHIPWRMLAALGLGLAAQFTLQPTDRSAEPGIYLYLLAAIFTIWSAWAGEWSLAAPVESKSQIDPLTVRQSFFWIGIVFGAVAFLAFGGGYFTSLNVFLWAFCLAFTLVAFWLGQPTIRPALLRIRAFLSQPSHKITLTPWMILLALSFALGVFFRTYQLNQVPPEMNSDHAEKLLDVQDVLRGETRLFFPRNTGREPLQFYLTAALATLFGTGISFTSLKLGTLLLGLFSLPFSYLLGKEIANRRVGWLAMTITGFSYWPNVLSRIGLRFMLYPAFVAPTLYFFVRGIRRSNRNDFILSGIFLGIGLHGYTPIRALPILLVVLLGLYLVHSQSRGQRKQTIAHLAVLVLISLVIFLPLLRYALDEPRMFAYRSLTRLGSWEQPLPGPAWQIFLSNLGRATLMFGWDNGEVWPVSIPHWPALDLVTAPLFYLGLALLLVRYLRQRHWLDLGLLVSIPILMLPSVLALAFPNENPVLNRAGGALVPAFLVVALALDGFITRLENAFDSSQGKFWGWSLLILLLAISAGLNYNLVFDKYYRQYRQSAWNTSEMGQVIHDFANSAGSLDTAWVVAYPHWVDTRLVGMQAGYAQKDYAVQPDQLQSTLVEPRAKLFLINPQDQASLQTLQQLYPQGWLQLYKSKIETKDFFLFFVPPTVIP